MEENLKFLFVGAVSAAIATFIAEWFIEKLKASKLNKDNKERSSKQLEIVDFRRQLEDIIRELN